MLFMIKIRKFNESIQDIESDINDILQESFIDLGIPVRVRNNKAQVGYNNTITSMENIEINIGERFTPEFRLKLSEDKIEDTKRLIYWSIDNVFGDFKIELYPSYGVFLKIDNIKDIDKLYTFKDRDIKTFVIYLRKSGWQNYGSDTKKVREYKFNNYDKLNNFIIGAMNIFKENNLQPDLFRWEELAVTIYLENSKDILHKKLDSLYINK
jgi:hypothetical protein